jgi:two-component system phosphate regulon sensor histidine kinase PhoR
MARGRFSSEVWRASLLLAGIPVALLAGLAALGLLDFWAAVAGAALTFFAIFLIVRWGLGELSQAVDVIDGKTDTPAPAEFGVAASIARTAIRQRQQHVELLDEIRQEHDRLRQVFEQVPAPLILLDADGNVTLANRATAAMLDREIATGPFLNLVRDPGFVETVTQTLADGISRQVEFTIAYPRQRYLAASVTGLDPNAGGGPALILIEDQSIARRVDQMRVDFVANASHELRTPLSTLTGYIETLTGGASEDPAVRQRFLDIMHAQATRMARLLDDLMSLSRIEMEEHIEPDASVDLRTLVQDQVEALQLAAGERQMNFRIDVKTPDDPLTVTGDQDQLTQVVQNLLDNAIKYGASGQQIQLELGRQPSNSADGSAGEVFFSVNDSGVGIAPEHVERLTERFYRVDHGRSRELGGTGLGLAIVKHILNRHDGRLVIDSTPGEGSRFAVFLPPAADNSEAEPTIAAQ